MYSFKGSDVDAFLLSLRQHPDISLSLENIHQENPLISPLLLEQIASYLYENHRDKFDYAEFSPYGAGYRFRYYHTWDFFLDNGGFTMYFKDKENLDMMQSKLLALQLEKEQWEQIQREFPEKATKVLQGIANASQIIATLVQFLKTS